MIRLNLWHCIIRSIHFTEDSYLIFILCLFLAKWNYVQGSQAPRITEHPIDTTVPRHEPATLNCKAEGNPAPTVQWYKDGVPLKIQPGSHRITLPAGGLFFLKVVASRRETDAGMYWCEARNEMGVARSRNASLHVAVLRDEFRIEPQNTRIAQGDTALLECAAPRGVPEPTVAWKKNGDKLDLDSSIRLRVVDGGNLAIQNVSQSDEGQYQCIARNVVGVRESTIVMLKVYVKPFIVSGPHDQTALEGSSVTFPCQVGGDPMPDVLWLRTASGGNMPLDRVSVMEDRSLRLERVTVADEGEYSCEAYNVFGAISAMGSLTVFAPPKFTQRPTSKSVELGADTYLECRATGNPRPTLIWTIRNSRSLIIPGALPLDRLHSFNSEDGHSIVTLTKFQRADKDLVLVCNAMNEVGSIAARAQLTLDSHEERPPPIIIAGPVNQTLPTKSLATLQCKAIGLPNPTISWYRDGILVYPSAKVNVTSAGDLIIAELERKQDQGLYTCVASSRTGKSTWSGYLRIEAPTNPNIKFYRAPDHSKYPSAPGQPRLLNVSASAVTIVWAPSDKSGAAPLLGYAVEMFSTNKSKTWIPIAARLGEPVCVVDSLMPGAAYIFLVRAENSFGFSAPSPISDIIIADKSTNGVSAGGRHIPNEDRDPLLNEVEKRLGTNNVVELLEAKPADSTTVRLTWDIDSGQYIEGFYVYAREIHRAEYKLMTVLNAADSGGPTECSVQGLQKATMYEFFLVPFYKNVVGKPSNTKYARTLEDVPEAAPRNMEAIKFNKTSVLLKWKPPEPDRARNGILTNYHVIVRGLDVRNTTRIYKNMTIDAATPTLLLANLTSGVTYYVAVAAATRQGIGPFSQPAVLRMDPRVPSFDNSYMRYPINRNVADDFLTQAWFIILLGSIVAVIVFLLGAAILFKRYLFMKQTSLDNLHAGNHTIAPVQKFPNLPTNGIAIDPTSGAWKQATACTIKEPLPDYFQITGQQTLALPDYERLTPLNMPDYAEVACSTFKNPPAPSKASPQNGGRALQTHSSCALYDNFGAYATTNLVANAKLYQHRYAASETSSKKATTVKVPQAHSALNSQDNTKNNEPQQDACIYSAPPSAYYSAGGPGGIYGGVGGTYFNTMAAIYPVLIPMQQNKMTLSTASTAILSSPAKKSAKNNASVAAASEGATGNEINITENKMEKLSDLISSTNDSITTKHQITTGHTTAFNTRYNPFNAATAPAAPVTTTASAIARQQLLTASHALKQGLGAYLNTTVGTPISSSSSRAATMRRPRYPKAYTSESSILSGNCDKDNDPPGARYDASAGNAANDLYETNSTATTTIPNTTDTITSASQLDFLTVNDKTNEFSSTNHLLNDWAASSFSAATDEHQFGSKQPGKQHIYVKSKDGSWSAMPSDAYQSYKQQQQQQLSAGEADSNQTTQTKTALNATPKSLKSVVSSCTDSVSRNNVRGRDSILQANYKPLSSCGRTNDV